MPTDATLQRRSDRKKTAPWGINGGEAGAHTSVIYNPGRDNATLGMCVISLKAGDSVRAATAGSGGWGLPVERDPAAVLQDVRDTLIDPPRAREVYAVVIDGDPLSVNERETAKMRARLSQLTMA